MTPYNNKLTIVSHFSNSDSFLLNASKSLQTEFAAVAHLAVGQFLKIGLTCNKGKVSEFPSGNSKNSNIRG